MEVSVGEGGLVVLVVFYNWLIMLCLFIHSFFSSLLTFFLLFIPLRFSFPFALYFVPILCSPLALDNSFPVHFLPSDVSRC